MSQQIVQEYIHRMNRADVEGLLELMTSDHVFFVDGELPLSGNQSLREAWKGYCAAYPTYTMYVDEIYDQHERVIVAGHTSGSHLPSSIEQKPSCVLWEARLRDRRIATWIIYLSHIARNPPVLSSSLSDCSTLFVAPKQRSTRACDVRQNCRDHTWSV
jgi:hypothetical protein